VTVARCCRRGSGAGVVPEWWQWQWRRATLDTRRAWTTRGGVNERRDKKSESRLASVSKRVITQYTNDKLAQSYSFPLDGDHF